MIVEAKRLKNGFFIPMIEQLKSIQKEHILLNIELIDVKSEKLEELEKKHRKGYLQHPVTLGEFSDWEDEQVWVD
jgi:hypothetical protein